MIPNAEPFAFGHELTLLRTVFVKAKLFTSDLT
jgi:hypothetical protein